MNLENIKNKKTPPPLNEDVFEDFDFKPITSGLGFHQPKATDVKPIITERTFTQNPSINPPSLKKDMNVYQNDLSLFYGQTQTETLIDVPETKVREEKIYRLATKPQRFFAYITDLFFVGSLLGIVLTIMSRAIEMDLLAVWSQFPNEITPLVVTLFCGFYIIYFSVFEKTGQSTLGKNLFNLRVLDLENKTLPLTLLILRAFIGLFNFVSLGLFSYFDLQNKVTHSKVVRID